MKKHILICDDDLKRYPPLISIINVLLSLNCEVIYLGYCSDKILIEKLKSKNLNYNEISVDKTQKNFILKYFMMYINTLNVLKYLRLNNCKKNTNVWVFGNENGWRLNKALKKYNSILYLFEMPKLSIPFKYRLVVPFLNLKKSIQSANKVVCCEYNRGQITKSFFDLSESPFIIPNKPYISEEKKDIGDVYNYLSKDIIEKIKNKKIILYQGGINNKERRLDLLCDSIQFLDEEFIICIMGAECTDKKILMDKYENERILFLPFISPPSHLSVTKLAYIGILNYSTNNPKIEETLNLLYCAPNKIFEYSKFSIPMVSNNLPSLKSEFEKFNSGICCKDFSPFQIAEAIKNISNNYENFSSGALSHYKSIDFKELIVNLIN